MVSLGTRVTDTGASYGTGIILNDFLSVEIIAMGAQLRRDGTLAGLYSKPAAASRNRSSARRKTRSARPMARPTRQLHAKGVPTVGHGQGPQTSL